MSLESTGKVVWWLLVFAAVCVALPQVNPWIGMPAVLFLLAGGIGYFGDN